MTIKADHLTFHYEEAVILDDVSFEINDREFVCIFGPNGGGKTTLLKLLMGFLKPHHGTIQIFGETPKEARSTIGYVPQISQIDRKFPITVLDVVLMGVLNNSLFNAYDGDAKERGLNALKLVGLLEYEQQRFGTLSGGQAQRALFARAIVSNPDILLLDEPTASVDAEAEETIYRLLESYRGVKTVIMVTHDLQVMTKKVDRFLCVNRQITPFSTADVCSHFAQGLYHTPIRSPRSPL